MRMSSACMNEQKLRKLDMLDELVKDLEFLQYEHSVEQVKPTCFDFSDGTKSTEICQLSNFGIDFINSFLHIGLVKEDNSTKPLNRNRILLLVWPQYVSPFAYADRKRYLPGIKKIKTRLFRVPEPVYLKYSNGCSSVNEVVAATAILAPVEEWKFLERLVISSFYHLTFDKPGTNAFGNLDVWNKYPIDKELQTWKQFLYVCCGPPPVAYVIKRMLKRNWARIVRVALSAHSEVSEKYVVFCQGDFMPILIQWSKFTLNNEAFIAFFEEVNSTKPILSPPVIMQKAKIAFATTVTNSKKFRCKMCIFESDNKGSYESHLRVHTGDKPFKCQLCGMSFRQLTHLTCHNILHTGIYPFSCEYCGRPFTNKANWKVHLVTNHRSDKTLKCYSCKRRFQTEPAMRDHVASHANDAKFQCSVCSRRFDAKSKLDEHYRVHSVEKPFKCDICQKGFLRAGALQAHVGAHAGMTNFDCEFCGKSFKRNGTRQRHQASVHAQYLM